MGQSTFYFTLSLLTFYSLLWFYTPSSQSFTPYSPALLYYLLLHTLQLLYTQSFQPFTPYSVCSILSTFYSIPSMLHPFECFAPCYVCSILSTFYSILCSILSTFYSIPHVPFSQPFTPYSQAPRYSILLPYKLTCIVKYNFKLINLSATLMLKSYSSDHQETSLIIYLPYSLGTLIPTRMFDLPMVKEVCILLFYNPHFWPPKINVYK